MVRWHLIVSSALIVAGMSAASAQTTSRYLLGPQDRLQIRVYDLRRNTGEAYSWTALNGEFSVGADGSMSLPIIGRLVAAGGTVNDLADAIGRKLKETADLAETPAASVEVAKYRPFYVTGAVQQPGKYEYQPNLSVLQAISTAQGLIRAADMRGVQREVVTAGGEVRALNAEHLALESKLARLDAEVSGRDSVTFSDSLRNQAGEPKVDEAMRNEKLIFESRRNSVKAQVAALEKLKVNYQQELVALDAKAKTLDRQVELIGRELSLVNDLVAKGLTITPRKLAAEQSQASYESNRLDVQVANLRTQQSISQAERDIIEVQDRFRRETLTEEADARMKLGQNEERIRTAERLKTDAESQMLASDGLNEVLIASYEISRASGNGWTTWRAQEDDVVEPGDVVRVTISRRPGNAAVGRSEVSLPPATRHVSESSAIDSAVSQDSSGARKALPPKPKTR